MSGEAKQLTPFAHAANNRCFGCGPANAVGLHLEFYLSPDNSVECRAAIADAYEGPPGYLHGGIIATLLDEAMSKAVRASGKVAMTRKMDVEYLRPVHSGTEIRIEGRMMSSERRKNWAEAAIFDSDETQLARATGLFIEVTPVKKA
jgi:uncharacterized protein (TIGR00369 family)